MESLRRRAWPGAANSDVRIHARCDECGALLALSTDGTAFYNPLGAAADAWSGAIPTGAGNNVETGDHRHDESIPEGLIRYYTLGPVGPWKYEQTGTWIDVLGSVPHLFSRRGPLPPRSVLNELLGDGRLDSGMSGGIECPPYELDVSDYEDIRGHFAAVCDLPEVRAPEGLTGDQFTFWRIGFNAGRRSVTG